MLKFIVSRVLNDAQQTSRIILFSRGGLYRDGDLVTATDDKVNESKEANEKLWNISAKAVNLEEE